VQDLTREPEMVKAYRDTWTLGIHSYLAYLRDRLELSVPYEFYGQPRAYEPDFVVRMADGT